jgi:hypothetical protein
MTSSSRVSRTKLDHGIAKPARRQNLFGGKLVHLVQLEQTRVAEVPKQRGLERALHVAFAKSPAPLDVVDGVTQFIEAVVGHGAEFHAEALADQLLQAGLVPEFQLERRVGYLAQARLELRPVRAIRPIDDDDDTLRVGHSRRGLLVFANKVLDHAIAGVAVFHLDEKGGPPRRAHHDVGKSAWHAQVHLTRNLHPLRA